MSRLGDFLGAPDRRIRPAGPPLRSIPGDRGVEVLDGRLVVVDRGRRLIASWSGGASFSIWSYDERGALAEEVAVVRCAVGDVDLSAPRSAADWLRERLGRWRGRRAGVGR